MEKLREPIGSRFAELSGGVELWGQFSDDAVFTPLAGNIVRISYPPDPALGRKQAVTMDFYVKSGPLGRMFIELDTEYLPQLPER